MHEPFNAARVKPIALCLLAISPPVAGQQIITLPARDKVLTEQPAKVFSIGSAEGADWEVLSRVRSAAFDAQDNLYVLDGPGTSKPRVLVFNTSGKFVRQFGRRGNGPGEFQAPRDLFVHASGDVVVSDPGNSAYIVFSPNGEHRAGFLAVHDLSGTVTRATGCVGPAL
jgi:hypothetical protein